MNTAPAIVSFHADRPAGVQGVHPNANLQPSEYMRMLDLLFRSARLSHRSTRCVLLTDTATRVLGLTGHYRRIDGPVDHAALMLSRAEAQLAFVEQDDFAHPIALLDSDILLNGSLSPLFSEDFDVALTWRPLRRMPINGGVILLNNRRPEAARAFFRRFVHLYRSKYATAGSAAWYGDQYALLHCLGATYDELSTQAVIVRKESRVRLLSCDTYNFSPENDLAAIDGGLPKKVVLHFKGPRKRLMQQFWTTFLEPRTTSWPLRNLHAWAARARFRQRLLDARAEQA